MVERVVGGRVMDVLAPHEVRATVSACGRRVERLATALARDDHRARAEGGGDGWRWEATLA